MMMRPCTLLTAALVVLVVQFSDAVADDEAGNLLQLPNVRVAQTTAPPGERGSLTALRDGSAQTVGTLTAGVQAPLEVVYEFGGRTVAPEKLVVRLPAAPTRDAATARVEILASSLSATTGFQKLRSNLLDPDKAEQSFVFTPVGAQWIMLRLTPPAGKSNIAVAEMEVLGRTGPPKTNYAFDEAPADALKVLEQLEATASTSISPDEAKLVADAKDGKLDDWSFAEAALLASGVVDADKRKQYLVRIDALEREARQAVAQAETPYEMADVLLQWLHDKAMSGGYVAQQTDLSTVLDAKKFNCVSSAALFNVIGKRLGLDVRAIEVPTHAFSILYDGNRSADIETTTPLGFNPARNRAAQKLFEQKTGFHYIPERYQSQRREVREAGLVALIYYNHGVVLSDQKKYHEALLANFRALSLDSEFDSAVKNALSTLANWGVELSRNNDFERALQVVQIGLKLAPKDATLLNNHKAVWQQYANAAMDAGKHAEALAILQRADKVAPGAGFAKMQSWVFIRDAEKLAKQGEWTQALDLVEPGFTQLQAKPLEELRRWRSGLFLRWSNQALEKKQFSAAADVLDRAMKVDQNDELFKQNLAYLAQEWASHARETRGLEYAQGVVSSLVKRYPNHQGVEKAAQSFVVRTVNELRGQGDFKQALDFVASAPFLTVEARTKLTRSVYDGWSQSFAQKKAWQKAVDVYAQALLENPKDPHVTNNLRATWSGWMHEKISAGDWSEAAAVVEKARAANPPVDGIEKNVGYIAQQWLLDAYGKGGIDKANEALQTVLKRFPKDDLVRSAAEGALHHMVADLIKGDHYKSAASAAAGLAAPLKDPKLSKSLAHRAYDAWARSLAGQKKWQAVLDVYAAALKDHPNDGHFEHNAVVYWHQYANESMDQKDWKKAIEIYRKALKQFPNDGSLKQNLKYCEQQAQRAQ